MMKKIFICLCLVLSLCACTSNSVETDAEESEVVETTEDIQTDAEETTEENDEDSTETDDNESEESSETNTKSNNSISSTSNNTSFASNSSTNTTSSSNKSSSSSQNQSSASISSNNSLTETTEETKIYCTYTIECSSILNHTDSLQSNYQIPSNGIIYSQTIEIEEDDTVMSILKRTGVSTDISLGYVKGIDGLYEFDCGSESGWTYSVNGIKPNVGASKYSVSDGDVIKWIYVVTRSEW